MTIVSDGDYVVVDSLKAARNSAPGWVMNGTKNTFRVEQVMVGHDGCRLTRLVTLYKSWAPSTAIAMPSNPIELPCPLCHRMAPVTTKILKA